MTKTFDETFSAPIRAQAEKIVKTFTPEVVAELVLLESMPRLVRTLRLQREHQTAIQHLRAILNEASTATQSWQAQQEARQWLANLDPQTPYPVNLLSPL